MHSSKMSDYQKKVNDFSFDVYNLVLVYNIFYNLMFYYRYKYYCSVLNLKIILIRYRSENVNTVSM